jgi:hypothetical protein
VQSYRHMGTVYSPVAPGPEIKAKAAGLSADVKRNLRHVLHSDTNNEMKSLFIKSHLLSRGLYNAATWPLLGKSLERTIHRAVMKPFRAILDVGVPFPARCTDSQAMQKLQLQTPGNMIRQLRLMLFSRVVVKGSQSLRRVLALAAEAQGSWASAIEDDFKYLAVHARGSKYESWAPLQWRAAAANAPSQYKKAVICVLNQAPKLVPKSVAREQDSSMDAVLCALCQASFESRQALAAHSFKVHGRRTEARAFLDTTSCPHCMLECWTRQRALDHLRRSGECNLAVLRLPKLDEETVLALDAESLENTRRNVAIGRQRNWAEYPCTRASGPLRVEQLRAAAASS